MKNSKMGRENLEWLMSQPLEMQYRIRGFLGGKRIVKFKVREPKI